MNCIQEFKNKEIPSLPQLRKEEVNGLTFPKISETEIPIELCEEIFSYLTGLELTNCAQVSKEWYKVVNHQDILWKGIVERYAIGPQMWKKKLKADIGKADPIPKKMLEILRGTCPFNKEKQVIKTHMLVWIPSAINGKPLTLNSFGKFLKTNGFSENVTGYRFFWPEVADNLGDITLEQSGWALMAKDPIPNSGYTNYAAKEEIMKKFSEYKMPKVLEAVFCIYAKFYSSKERLFSDNYVAREEQVDGYQVIISRFEDSGISIRTHDDDTDYFGDGIAAIRKFY